MAKIESCDTIALKRRCVELFFAFLVRKLPEYYFLKTKKRGPKNNIPDVFLTKKAKNMNHGSPLFPTM